MPIDPTVPLGGVAPPQANPLGMLGQLATTTNAINQNKLFQQEFAARQAIGPLYQQAIDPTTGQLDTNKLMSLASQNPNTAFMAGDLANQALGRQAQEVQISGGQLDQALKKLGAVRSSLGSLLAMGADGKSPTATPQDVINSTMDLVGDGKTGVLKPQEAVTSLQGMPTDPAQFKQWLTNHYINSLEGESKINAIAGGQPQTLSIGGQTLVVRVPSVPGQTPTVVADVANTLSPGEAVSPAYQQYNPVTKQMETVTKGAAAAAASGAPSPTGGAAPTGAPPAAIPAGPPLGASSAAETAGAASAQQGIDLQKAADTVPQTKALLSEAMGALKNFTPGPAADLTHTVNALATQFGIPIPGAAKGAQAQEVFNKVATQIAQQQFGALGGTGTDSKLESARHSSPDQFLTTLGNQGVIPLLQGNADAIAVKNQAWQAWQKAGHGPESYGDFSTQFNKLYDPRVFQQQYMAPAEQAQMRAGMSKAEQAQFDKSEATAKKYGWIQ